MNTETEHPLLLDRSKLDLSRFNREREWKLPRTNVFSTKLREIKDIPREHRLVIFGKGAMVGDDDVISRDVYSCDLTCIS